MTAPAPEKNPAAVQTAGLEIAVQRQREGSADPGKREPTTAAGAVEKAVPIPAEIAEQLLRVRQRLIDRGADAVALEIARNVARRVDQPEWGKLINLVHCAILDGAALLAAQASQEERIREDERDRLLEIAYTNGKFLLPVHDQAIRQFLTLQRAMLPADRARLRGDAS